MEIQLDIDRLHRVIDGDLQSSRYAGRTTAALVQALQSAEVHAYIGSGIFVVVTMNDLVSDSMLRYSRELLESLGMSAVVDLQSRSILFPSLGVMNEVRFIAAESIPRRLSGVRIVNYYLDNSVPCLKQDEYDFIESRLERE